MKKPVIETLLSSLDNSLRWTGIPARVADEMADGPSVDRRQRPLRWTPIWPIAFSFALVMVSLIWPPALMSSMGVATWVIAPAFGGAIWAIAPAIYAIGPLGKSSLEDDERESALRRDSYLFCFGLLAVLNCLGQPLLMILAVFQHWQPAHSASVLGSVLMLNGTLFGCLPTLYASWKSSTLPNE